MSAHDKRLLLREDLDIEEGAVQVLCDFIGMDWTQLGDWSDKEMITFFSKKIDEQCSIKIHDLDKLGKITKTDVDRSLSSIHELTLGSFHRVMKIGGRNI